MSTACLTIDLAAVAANWRALSKLSCSAEAGAVVKADSYGLGAAEVAPVLARAGARRFFVAGAEEGVAVRAALGPGPEICVFSGHMAGDAELLRAAALVPMLNSPEQVARHLSALPDVPYGVQLDTGMNRLGLEPADWADLRGDLGGAVLVISHLACADAPDHPMNPAQLAQFRAMTEGVSAPRSLAATGGILLGPEYHFDVTRPGIGLYGGLPFAQATPVVRLSLPVVQTRRVEPGETVGYAQGWRAETAPARIATVAAGYADGIPRALSGRLTLFAGNIPCPVRGRVSMDLITVDVTHLDDVPEALDLLGPAQGVDAVADVAGTIGYEILTSLGARYARRYEGGA